LNVTEQYFWLSGISGFFSSAIRGQYVAVIRESVFERNNIYNQPILHFYQTGFSFQNDLNEINFSTIIITFK